MTWTVCDLCGVVVADQDLHGRVCHPSDNLWPLIAAPTEEDPDGDE